MEHSFRFVTYGLIVGGLLLTIFVGATPSKGRDFGFFGGLIGGVFLLTMTIVTSVALFRQASRGLCVANFILIAAFSSLLAAGMVAKKSLADQHRMRMHIYQLERALEKTETPFRSFDSLK